MKEEALPQFLRMLIILSKDITRKPIQTGMMLNEGRDIKSKKLQPFEIGVHSYV